MIQRVLLFLLFVHGALLALPLSFDFFKDKPKSISTDFYISQFLTQGASDKEAEALLPLVKNLNPKLFSKFAKQIPAFKRKAYCQTRHGEQFLETNHDCVAMGLPLYKATKLPPPLLEKIANNIALFEPKLSAKYHSISTQSFDALLKLPPKALIETFNQVGSAFRKAHYNHPLPAKLLPTLIKEPLFSVMIEKIVRGAFEPLQKSLLDINASELDAASNFLLALNTLRYQSPKRALTYLKTSQKKAKFDFEKDKALFWQYLITKEDSLLETLTKSHGLNIYSLYAFEALNHFPENIITEILPKSKTAAIDITDPFAWLAFKAKVKSTSFHDYQEKKAWLMKHNAPDMEAHIAQLLYRYKENQHYFLTPYSHFLSNCQTKRKILIYALARQESYFIPTEISYSYALGMMQFMPFVAKEIAKKEKIENFQYEMMFDPEVSYHFANIHLDFLEKSFTHPLFIAYAYNAGIGFTKRKITSQNYFKDGAFEPFWSLEMVPNAQARKYGKRVLANYAIYAKLLDAPITLHTLFEMLK